MRPSKIFRAKKYGNKCYLFHINGPLGPEGERPGAMRPAIRRRLGIAFVLSACLAVPLLVGWFPQEPLRAPAERLAGQLLGARVSIGELTLTPGLLWLRAARVRAEAPGWEVEVAAIEIALDAGVVFGGQPSLRSVTIVSHAAGKCHGLDEWYVDSKAALQLIFNMIGHAATQQRSQLSR